MGATPSMGISFCARYCLCNIHNTIEVDKPQRRIECIKEYQKEKDKRKNIIVLDSQSNDDKHEPEIRRGDI